jgi:hypothetical protein
VLDVDHGAGRGEAGVLGIRRAEASRGDGALHEALEPVGVEAGRGGLGDAAVVHHDPQAHVVLVAGHVLVDAAVGEPRERAGALAAGDQRVGAVAHELEDAVAGREPALGHVVGARVPRH